MRSFLFTIGCSLLTTLAEAAGDPPGGDDLFPLAVNNRWVYRFPGQEDRLTITAAAEEKIGDVLCIRLEGRLHNRTIATEHIAVRKDGAYRFRNDSADLEPPLLICKFPAEKGDGWQADYKFNDKKASLVYECGQEEVTVPAGKFKAIVVHSEAADGTGRLKNTVWYVPKIGMVKQVVVDGDRTITLLLESFEHDKEPGSKRPMKKGLK